MKCGSIYEMWLHRGTATRPRRKWQAAAQVRTSTRKTNRRARSPSAATQRARGSNPSRAVTRYAAAPHQRQLHAPAPLTTRDLTTPPKPRTREWPFRDAPAAPVVVSKSTVTSMMAEQSVPHSGNTMALAHEQSRAALESPCHSRRSMAMRYFPGACESERRGVCEETLTNGCAKKKFLLDGAEAAPIAERRARSVSSLFRQLSAPSRADSYFYFLARADSYFYFSGAADSYS